MRKITLRPISDEDIMLLTTWLNKDYILKWYQEPEEWLTEINNRNGAYSWIHHFIVMDENIPIGFCQYYDCFYANDMEDWYSVVQKNNTFSIDYLIGNEAYLGKGYGKGIVSLLTDTIKEKEQAKQIIVQPDKENLPSNKVLLSNGYIFDKYKDYYYKLLD
jgi:RimJ/RimL family protein N-acetyltransferase